jgi:hypothetical protein
MLIFHSFSLATDRIIEYGFLETPIRKIRKEKYSKPQIDLIKKECGWVWEIADMWYVEYGIECNVVSEKTLCFWVRCSVGFMVRKPGHLWTSYTCRTNANSGRQCNKGLKKSRMSRN